MECPKCWDIRNEVFRGFLVDYESSHLVLVLSTAKMMFFAADASEDAETQASWRTTARFQT